MATVTGSQDNNMRSEYSKQNNIDNGSDSHVETINTKANVLDDLHFDENEKLENNEVHSPLPDPAFPRDRNNPIAMRGYLMLRFSDGDIFETRKYCNCEAVTLSLLAELKRLDISEEELEDLETLIIKPNQHKIDQILTNYPMDSEQYNSKLDELKERNDLNYILREKIIIDFDVTPSRVPSHSVSISTEIDKNKKQENVSEFLESTPKSAPFISGSKRSDKGTEVIIIDDDDNPDFQTPPRKRQRVENANVTPVTKAKDKSVTFDEKKDTVIGDTGGAINDTNTKDKDQLSPAAHNRNKDSDEQPTKVPESEIQKIIHKMDDMNIDAVDGTDAANSEAPPPNPTDAIDDESNADQNDGQNDNQQSDQNQGDKPGEGSHNTGNANNGNGNSRNGGQSNNRGNNKNNNSGNGHQQSGGSGPPDDGGPDDSGDDDDSKDGDKKKPNKKDKNKDKEADSEEEDIDIDTQPISHSDFVTLLSQMTKQQSVQMQNFYQQLALQQDDKAKQMNEKFEETRKMTFNLSTAIARMADMQDKKPRPESKPKDYDSIATIEKHKATAKRRLAVTLEWKHIFRGNRTPLYNLKYFRKMKRYEEQNGVLVNGNPEAVQAAVLTYVNAFDDAARSVWLNAGKKTGDFSVMQEYYDWFLSVFPIDGCIKTVYDTAKKYQSTAITRGTINWLTMSDEYKTVANLLKDARKYEKLNVET